MAGGNIKIWSLKSGRPDDMNSNDLGIFITPTTSVDYKIAQGLASDGVTSVVINGFAKVSLNRFFTNMMHEFPFFLFLETY